METIRQMQEIVAAHEYMKGHMRTISTVGSKTLTEKLHAKENFPATMPTPEFFVIGAGETLHVKFGTRVIVLAMAIRSHETPAIARIHLSMHRDIGLKHPKELELGHMVLQADGTIHWDNATFKCQEKDSITTMLMHVLIHALSH